jgi:hypothetical protein
MGAFCEYIKKYMTITETAALPKLQGRQAVNASVWANKNKTITD